MPRKPRERITPSRRLESIDSAFAKFEIERVIHCIDRENTASQGVARRLESEKGNEIELVGHVADVCVMTRFVTARLVGCYELKPAVTGARFGLVIAVREL